MSKDTYYFPHDINAFLDPKIRVLISEYGIMSYAVFWIIVEMLASQKDYKIPVDGFIKSLKPILQGKHIEYSENGTPQGDGFYDDDNNRVDDLLVGCHRIELAYATGIFHKMIEVGLFKTDGQYFWSNSLFERMQNREIKSQKQRENALKRWHPEPITDTPDATALPLALPTAMPPISTGNAQEERRKEEEEEEEEINSLSKKEDDKKEIAPPLSQQQNIDILKYYELKIEPLTNLIANQLNKAEVKYTTEWVRQAIDQAVLKKKKDIRYILAILKKCYNEGHSPQNRKNGKHSSNNDDPDKYINGKYGHVVQR